jgi:hypothetical protein
MEQGRAQPDILEVRTIKPGTDNGKKLFDCRVRWNRTKAVPRFAIDVIMRQELGHRWVYLSETIKIEISTSLKLFENLRRIESTEINLQPSG